MQFFLIVTCIFEVADSLDNKWKYKMPAFHEAGATAR